MANKSHHLECILKLFTLRYINGILITVLVAYSHYYALLDEYSLHLLLFAERLAQPQIYVIGGRFERPWPETTVYRDFLCNYSVLDYQ